MSETNGHSTEPQATDPTVAYATAPGIIAEIGWIARRASTREFGSAMDREFWIRKAALLDRIALQEVDTYAPEVATSAVQTAEQAALRLVERDSANGLLSLRGADLASGPDHREYVREAYHAWSLTQAI